MMSQKFTIESTSEAQKLTEPQGNVPHEGDAALAESDLSLELQMAIEEYISLSSVRSVAFLARKSGLPYSTVRRAAQGEGTPTFATVVSILEVIMTCKDLLQFVSKHFPGAYETLSTMFSNSFSKGETAPISEAQLKQYLFNPISNHILHLCLCGSGTTEQKIQLMFGELGMRKLRAMMKDGYIVSNGETLTFYRENLSKRPFIVFLRDIEVLTEIFDAENLNSDAALLATIIESVSLTGLAKIKAAGLEYLQAMRHLSEAHSDAGTIPFFAAVLQTMVDSSAYREECAASEQPNT